MRKLHLLLPLVLIATSAHSQPTMTSIAPGYGGTGPNSAGTWTITGTGFSTAMRATRFVDVNNADVFINVSCSTTTTCTAGLRPSRVPIGSAQTLGVFALVNGVKSGSLSNFLYYGEPTITSVVPSSSAANVDTAGVVNGGPFTFGGAAFGDTTVILYSYVHDYTTGCTSGTQCGFSASSPVLHDCCNSQGSYPLTIYTPGGAVSSYFTFGATLATPTITSIVPGSGPAAGGTQTDTITGTNFATTALGTTSFTFVTHGSFGTSNPATSVSCPTTTSCTALVPNGGSGGLADVQVQTICKVGACSGNTRASVGIPGTKVGAYSYAGLAINPGSSTTLTTTENGQAAQFTVALNSQPSANVHVAVNGGAAMVPTSGGRATVSPTGLDFTSGNWSQPQTVTVTGIDDTGTGGAGSAAAPGTFNAGYSVGTQATSADLNYNSVFGNDQQFVNLDNDSANVYIAPTSGLVTSRKGKGASFKVALTKAPATPVTIGLTSNDPLEGLVSPASLTFATTPGGANGWNLSQTVAVRGLGLGAAGRDMPYGVITTLSSGDAAYNTLFSNFGVQNVSLTNVDGFPSGDFDHDGKSEIVWLNSSTGDVYLYYMGGAGGTTVLSGGAVVGAPTVWSVAGVADFDGNGQPDLVWRNSATGEVYVYYLGGTGGRTVLSGGGIAGAPTVWTIAAVTDVDGDGQPDLVWHNSSTGEVYVYYLGGAGGRTVLSGGAISGAPTVWKLAGFGDFDRDGHPDMLWHNTSTGDNYIYYLGGVGGRTVLSGAAVVGAPTVWTIGSVVDLNGDGHPDILWRNTSTGDSYVYNLGGATGTTLLSGAGVPGAPTVWSMVGP